MGSRAAFALIAAAATLVVGGATALALISSPTAPTSSPAPAYGTTASISGSPSSPGSPTSAGSPTYPSSPGAASSEPTATTSTPTGASPTSSPTASPSPALPGVTIKSLGATGKSGQATATIRYHATKLSSPKIECRVGSASGAPCQGSPWSVGTSGGTKRLKVGGLDDGVRTKLVFFQSAGGSNGPASAGRVVAYGPIGAVSITSASPTALSSGFTLGFTVQVDPGGRPVNVTVTDSAGNSWTAKTGRLGWKKSHSFTELESSWNTTVSLTVTVTDVPVTRRQPVSTTTSQPAPWLKTYTIKDPVYTGTCATQTVDTTWYDSSGCTNVSGSWITNGNSRQVTCAVKSSTYYYSNGNKNGPTFRQWYWFFRLQDGTYIHSSATQESTKDGADGNPPC